MSLSLDELTNIYSDQIWLELLPEDQEIAWQKIQKYSNPASCWNAYLNYLSLHQFATLLEGDPTLPGDLNLSHLEEYSASLWEFINGTKLTLGSTQIVLIPTDKNGISEFRVPQEWVDIPNWIADYYVAIELNLDEHWMRVCGYTTHEKIKKLGIYDLIDRTYCLEIENLEPDINVMWVAMELFTVKTIEVPALPHLSELQIEKLLEKLSKHTHYSPRLELKFEEWAALIVNDEIRQKLYRNRLSNSPELCSHERHQVETDTANSRSVNNLSLWLQNIFESGWQSLDTLLGTNSERIGFQFRMDSNWNEVRVKSAKLVDLGMELKGMTIILLIGLTVEADRRVGIRVQLYPATGETYLPPSIALSLVSEGGGRLQEVQSRSHDNYIQLKRFKSPPGKRFAIEVSLGDISIKEHFILSEALPAEQNG